VTAAAIASPINARFIFLLPFCYVPMYA